MSTPPAPTVTATAMSAEPAKVIPAEVLPWRHAPEMAQQVHDRHSRDPFRGTCRICRRPSPCQDRQDAATVLGYHVPPVSTRTLRPRVAVLVLLPVLGGLVAAVGPVLRVIS